MEQTSVTEALGLPDIPSGSLSDSNEFKATREKHFHCVTERVPKESLMQTTSHHSDGLDKITEKYESVIKLRSSVARDKLGENGPIVRDSGERNKPTTTHPNPLHVFPLKDGSVVNNSSEWSTMSGGSSDVSEPSQCSSTNSSAAHSLTEQDFMQVEMFFRSHKTEVHVCRCLANLYFANGTEKKTGKQNWEFSATGVPLLVLDTGEHHRKRSLQFIMAEKGTGFVLFKDVIDHLTKYSAPHSNFHTMQLSTDHTKQAGLSFDDTAAAADFHNYLMSLISNPDDDLLKLSKKKKKKDASKPKVKKYKPPQKAEISQPCCFVHVTKLERPPMSLADDFAEGMDKSSVSSGDTLDELA